MKIVDDTLGLNSLKMTRAKKEQDIALMSATMEALKVEKQKALQEQLNQANQRVEQSKEITLSEDNKSLEGLEPISVPLEEAKIDFKPLTQEDIAKNVKIKKANKVKDETVKKTVIQNVKDKVSKVLKIKNKDSRTYEDIKEDELKRGRTVGKMTDEEKERVLKKRKADSNARPKLAREKGNKRIENKNYDFIPYVMVMTAVVILGVWLGVKFNTYYNYLSTNQNSANGGFVSTTQTTNYTTKDAYSIDALVGEYSAPLMPLHADLLVLPIIVCLVVGGVACVFVWSSESDRKRMRVGHEHGKGRISTKNDIKFYQNRFMSKNPRDNLLFTEHIGLSLDNTKANRTANVVVIGGSGTGKTYKFVKPNIMQQNCSMLITDPSGDIYRSFGGYLLDKGFNVYLFNVKDMELSNHYNPLMNVFDANGNISEVKVDILVDLYMKNAKAGKEAGGGDPFWDKSEKAFLTALIYYVLENDAFEEKDKCFRTILEKAQDAKADTQAGANKDGTKLTKEIKEWQKQMEASGKKIKTPLYYDTFLIAPDKTANTILITTAVDLQLFATDDVARITRTNTTYTDMNINFDKIAEVPSYVFLCIPQQHDAYNFLISMFYSQAFGRFYEYGEKIAPDKHFIGKVFGISQFEHGFDSKEEAEEFRMSVTTDDILECDYVNNTKIYKLMYKGKDYRTMVNRQALEDLVNDLGNMYVFDNQRKAFHNDPALPVHINCLLDEFANIGEIPNFLTTLSTCRKYRIGCQIIIQNTGQIKTIYKDQENETLFANVDTTIFLGSIKTEDKKFIQEMLGKTTIIQKSTSGSKQGNSTTYTPTEVDLMSLDEISAINDVQTGRDDAIVIVRDYYPFVDNKLLLYKHPNNCYLEEYNSRKDKVKQDNYFRNDLDNSVLLNAM